MDLNPQTPLLIASPGTQPHTSPRTRASRTFLIYPMTLIQTLRFAALFLLISISVHAQKILLAV